MKAIILAAGATPDDNHTPWVLRKLGDKPIIDYVIELARPLVQPSEMVVVIDEMSNAVAQYLGSDYTYVVQSEPQGTGAAVLAAQRALAQYDGPILILYGDTALLQPSSILGLVTRHRLKGAGLTLLTAETHQELPYGRVLAHRRPNCGGGRSSRCFLSRAGNPRAEHWGLCGGGGNIVAGAPCCG
ncbi:MAG: NTP transferase domain-containing protein [Caldilineaceae bacterium]